MEYYSNYIWEKNGRKNNEDSLCLKQVTKDGITYLLAAVCDGIGGLKEGENASTYVADRMGEELLRLLEQKRKLHTGIMRKAFLRSIYGCHQFLQIYSGEKGIRLGTTLSMVVLCGRKGYLFHVGDSAVFTGKRRLRRRTGLHRTKDGALKQAVGVGQALRVECKSVHMKRGKAIFLASDGFYQKIEGDIGNRKQWKQLQRELHDCKQSKQLQKKHCNYNQESVVNSELEIGLWLKRIYKKALQNGSRDNATAICVVGE